MADVSTILEYVKDDDVKFIRLQFVDVFGNQKNISIMPSELERAFKFGVSIDAWAIKGFKGEEKSDLLLFPNPETLAILPWRPREGRVVRMICDIKNPDGTPFEVDTRDVLKNAIKYAASYGVSFGFGSEMEFYLFKEDVDGNPTNIPYDTAMYMDVAPEDKGENIRREICLALSEMGIQPSGSHHEEGPGQNEIHYHYSDPLTSADNAITYKNVVRTIASINGIYASFEPSPIEGKPGNGHHINISVDSKNKDEDFYYAIGGILKHIKEITLFLNPTENSYKRLGHHSAPKYIAYSYENRSDLIRIPAAKGEFKRFELRSSDCLCNPYIAFSLLIYAMMDGILNKIDAGEPMNLNLFEADDEVLKNLDKLPNNIKEATELAKKSMFIKEHLNERILESFLK